MKMLRRGLAMLLSVALVFSLVAVVASPNWTNTASWGKLSRYYETGNIDDEAAAGVISTVPGDPGGKSYGAYMFASKSGTIKSFINWCLNDNAANTAAYSIGEKLYKAYYSGGEGCGPLFDQAWTELAEADDTAFFNAQEAYVRSNIYDEAIALIRASYPNFNVDYYSVALKNVIWSRAVHHGPSGAASIIKDAFASLGGFANQAEGDLIMAIYEQSGTVVDSYKDAEKMNGSLAAKYDVDGKVLRYWYGSSPGVQLAVYRRLHVNEPADALSMMQTNAFVKASLAEGNYTITVKKDSSTLALGVSESTVKVVNTAGENPGTPAKFTLNYLSGVDAYVISTFVGDTAMRLTAGTADSSAFGSVTLTVPSTSDSQLWHIDGDGNVKSKATGTYLAYRNDTLVLVGADGSSTTLTSTAAPSANDKTEIFKLTASAESVAENTAETGSESVSETQTVDTGNGTENSNAESPAPPTTETETNAEETPAEKILNVTFVVGENGVIDDSSTASFVAGESTDFAIEALPAVTTKNGWTFVGWFTENGTEVKVGSTCAAGDLSLYAKYAMTATVSPAAWIFSSAVESSSDITVRHLIYPDANTELHVKDSGFPVRGMISCSGTISKVTLSIPEASISAKASPEASYYDLSNLDSKVSYSTLPQGTYTYKLTAKVGNTTYTLVESEFTVDAAVAPDVSTPSTGDKFTVTFDAGDKGTSEYTSKTYSLDSIVYGDLPTVFVQDPSFEFVGWFTSDGVQILPGTAVVAENITLYARYTSEYTYTFLKANGDTYRSGSVAAGSVFKVPLTAPTKAPDNDYTYKFSHWVDDSGKKYSSSQSVVMGEGDITFTPVYTKEARPSGGGSGSSSGGGGSTGGGGGSSSGGGGSTGGGGGSSSGGGGSTGSGGGSSSGSATPSGSYWTLTPGVSVEDMDGTVYKNGSVVTSGNLATGMVVNVGGDEFVISVTGDLSGDGKITVTDVVKLQSHLLNKINLSGAYLKAADLNSDGKVSITDLVKSARVVAGKDTIG